MKRKVILLLIITLLALSTPSVYAKPPAVDLDQVRNGPASAPYNPLQWQNGNLNAQHSHYVEGYSAIYRAVMTDLPTDGTVITLEIGYDITDQGKHALDYLTHYDYIDDPTHLTTFSHTQEAINPLLGVSGVSGTLTTYAIPVPSSTVSPIANMPTNSFNNLPAGKNLMTLFGGTISNVAYTDEGVLTATHGEARVSITFTVDSETAILAWGGHIASEDDWGSGNSAGAINGSPYHMRLIDWTLNNLGNQDRSLKIVASVATPGTIIVEKQTTPDGDSVDFDFTSDTLGSFMLADDETISFTGLDPGVYDVSETVLAGWTLTSAIADDGSPINALDLSEGETITVLFENTKDPVPLKGKIIVNKIIDLGLSSGYTNDIYFDFTGDVVGSITHGEQLVRSDLDAGIYTVTENNLGWTTSIVIDDPSGGSSSLGPVATINLAQGETVTVTYTNEPPDFVIPEFPFGTIGALAVMLGTILLIRNKKLPFLTQ